jgi:hypothetical protein
LKIFLVILHSGAFPPGNSGGSQKGVSRNGHRNTEVVLASDVSVLGMGKRNSNPLQRVNSRGCRRLTQEIGLTWCVRMGIEASECEGV